MALFKICRGNEANLPSFKTDGYAYFCTDTGNFFIDWANSSGSITRSQINSDCASAIRYKNGSEYVEIEASTIASQLSNIQTQLNAKAPSIGIGTYAGDLNDYATLMNKVCWVNGSTVANSPSTNWAIVETWGNGSGIVVQRVTTVSQLVAIRVRYNNAWEKWVWEVPESRTINGKALSSNITLSAADVGARENTWLPTLAQLGVNATATELNYVDGVTSGIQTQLNAKAPSIGIGTYAGDLNDYATLMNKVCWVNGSTVANSPSTNWAIVETWGNGGAIIIQRFTTTARCTAMRMYYNSAWTEWEWENPPMELGVEYRTTKRVQYLVVYTKRFSFGTLPNATAKRVQIPNYTDANSLQNMTFIAKHNSADHAMQLAYSADNGFFMEETANDIINIVVDAEVDMSAYTGYVTIEYTK